MKNLAIILAFAMLLTILSGCGEQKLEQTDVSTVAATEATVPETTEAQTEVVTEIPTEMPTEAPTETPTEVEEGEPMTDIDPMGLAGTWQRTHTEVEGYKSPNTNATITIAGPDSGSLTFTFNDQETANFNTKEKTLVIEAGQLFADCGNDIWYAKAADNKNTYEVTLLDDNTLLLQLTFDFDGQPMVSTQWFARSN